MSNLRVPVPCVYQVPTGVGFRNLDRALRVSGSDWRMFPQGPRANLSVSGSDGRMFRRVPVPYVY